MSSWLQSRFKHPSEYQARLIASLAALRACQRQGEECAWFPAVDILENRQEYLFTVNLPGLTREAFPVYGEKDALSMTGNRTTPHATTQPLRNERALGPCRFASPDDASRMENDATLKDGVLELHVPKTLPEDGTAKPPPERIEVRIKVLN